MDILQTFGGLLGLGSLCLIPLMFLLVPVIIFFIIRGNLNSHKSRRNLRLNGVLAPAIVTSAWNNYGTGGGRYSRATHVNVTFTVEVQPENQPSFVAKFKELVPTRSDERIFVGNRADEVGQKIWVCYDPKNRNRMIIDHYDKNHEWAMKRLELEKIDARDKGIRNFGEAAVATILEAEDLKLANNMEKEYMERSAWRHKLEITPTNGPSFMAETRGMFANKSLYKYAVGKKVNVKFNPRDRSQVTIINSAEEGSG